MSKIHFRPRAPFSWPSNKRNPRMRTFLLANNIVCPAKHGAESTDDDKRVTCERCLKIFLSGRYDSDETVDTVLSRGECP